MVVSYTFPFCQLPLIIFSHFFFVLFCCLTPSWCQGQSLPWLEFSRTKHDAYILLCNNIFFLSCLLGTLWPVIMIVIHHGRRRRCVAPVGHGLAISKEHWRIRRYKNYTQTIILRVAKWRRQSLLSFRVSRSCFTPTLKKAPLFFCYIIKKRKKKKKKNHSWLLSF